MPLLKILTESPILLLFAILFIVPIFLFIPKFVRYIKGQHPVYQNEESLYISCEIENEKDQKLGMIIFLGVGIFVFVIGIFIQINNMKFIKSVSTTEATITKIESHYESASSDDGPTYYVYITYKVNDVIYDELLDLYYTGMHEGQKIEIYYDPKNPADCKSKHAPYAGLMVIGFSILFLGVTMIIQKSKY